MRRIRIYDATTRLIGLHLNVLRSTVTAPGVLVLYLLPAPDGEIDRVAYAHGYWAYTEEIVDPASASPEAGETFTSLPVPVVLGAIDHALTLPVTAGPAPDLDPPNDLPFGPVQVTELPLRPTIDENELADLLRPPVMVSDRDRVAAAMAVHCRCAELRCPTVLNPASKREKRFWKTRQHHGIWHGQNATGPDPLMRCIYIIGHNQAEQKCEWREGGWPFGPAEHHPECPRHPEQYNRPGAVALPWEATADAPAAVPEGALLSPAPPLSLVRGYVGGPVGRHHTPEEPGMGYDREQLAEPEWFLTEKRKMWGVCAVPGPDSYVFPVWCTELPGHGGELHLMTRPDETVSWARRTSAAS